MFTIAWARDCPPWWDAYQYLDWPSEGYFQACWTVWVGREHMWECYYRLCSSKRFQNQVVKALMRNYWQQGVSSELSNKNLRDLPIQKNFSIVRLIWSGRKWQSTRQKCGPTQLTGQGWATWCTYSICCSCLVLELQQYLKCIWRVKDEVESCQEDK